MKTKLYTDGRLWMYCILCLVASTSVAQQVPRSLTASNGVFIGFYEYKPVDYDQNPQHQIPTHNLLTWIGERGDGTTQLPRVRPMPFPNTSMRAAPCDSCVNGQWQTFSCTHSQLSTNYGPGRISMWTMGCEVCKAEHAGGHHECFLLVLV
jgi:hypothetical protein